MSLCFVPGGAAGVVSRITGSVGKGLAAITMDKEYQQKRREEMGRQPKDFGDSLARGGKGLLRVSVLDSPEPSATLVGSLWLGSAHELWSIGMVVRASGGFLSPFCSFLIIHHQICSPNSKSCQHLG